MGVSYNKLFKLLIDKQIRKGELATKAGIAPNTILRLSRNENVGTEILAKICRVLDCTLDDIVEIEKEQ